MLYAAVTGMLQGLWVLLICLSKTIGGLFLALTFSYSLVAINIGWFLSVRGTFDGLSGVIAWLIGVITMFAFFLAVGESFFRIRRNP